MVSLLDDNPTSGYVLAQWAIQFCIEHPTQFAQFMADRVPTVETNETDIVPDLEMVKGLLAALATATDSLISGGIGIRAVMAFPIDSLFDKEEIPPSHE